MKNAERKKLEEERERLLNELKRSNKELEQFAYIASHDLQEPLRMVSSYVQLLGHRYKGRLDKDADEFIGYAVNGTAHMQLLLNDLLAYSRVGTRNEPYKLIDLKSAFDKALINLKVETDGTRAEITHETFPVIYADEVQMVQVFQNLLSNAMKFCKTDTPLINVSSEMKDDEWVVRVKDNGIGIDPKYFDRIFQIFKRLHSREEYQGTGIGLAICKKIIDRHKGRIWVESGYGKGATFCFTIPVKRQGPAVGDLGPGGINGAGI
ncbi:MAG: GHKL domain-containing protein [Nitrospirae bacterium]|nr:GHKL domain-containing protein [Nitrospirota bacterium]